MMDIDDLVIGQKYVFRRHGYGGDAKFQPATFFGLDHLGIPTVQFCFDNSMEELPNAMFDPLPKPLTEEWLKREMMERHDTIMALKAESDAMFDLLKGLKS